MQAEGYNGYANYETWLVALNIDNEYHLHKANLRRALSAIEERNPGAAQRRYAAWLRHFTKRQVSRAPSGDVTRNVIKRCDFSELASFYMLDAKEHKEHEEAK